MFGKKRAITETYKSERKMRKGIEKMAQKGWTEQKSHHMTRAEMSFKFETKSN